LESVLDLLYNKSLIGDLKDREGDFVGELRTLLDREPWIRLQLERTHHLGALKDLSLPGTRWQYVVLSCSLLLKLKQEYPGLRLKKAKTPSRPPASGLEVVQAWTLLTNLGHLFGTFATERGVFYALRRDDALRAQFLLAIVEELREHSRDILTQGEVRDFYYALAAFRVSRRLAVGDDRVVAIDMLREFFRERSWKIESSRMWCFRAARQLAYNRMHMYLRAGHAIDAVHSDARVGDLLPYNDFAFEARSSQVSSRLKQMLDAIDSYHLESFFTGPPAAAAVLAHQQALDRWWSSRDVGTEGCRQRV